MATLLLAPGKLTGVMVQAICQAHQFQLVHRSPAPFLRR